MADRQLSDTEIARMETPLWEQAKAAIDAGDGEHYWPVIVRQVDKK